MVVVWGQGGCQELVKEYSMELEAVVRAYLCVVGQCPYLCV